MISTAIRSILKRTQRLLGRSPTPYRFLRTIWTPSEGIYQHLHFTGEIEVPVARGMAFKMISYGNTVENDLFWRGYAKGWEAPSLALWRDLAARSKCIVDVGSNTGVYALAAQAVNRAAKVMAVEPSRLTFRCLKENIALNDFPIIAEEVAASDQNGPVKFYDFPGSHQYLASLEEGCLEAVPVEVEAVCLDTLFEKHGFKVDLLKMDVEGHEPAALRGMKKTLEAHRPTLIIEILDDEADRAVKKELDGLGYSARRLGDRNVIFEASN